MRQVAGWIVRGAIIAALAPPLAPVLGAQEYFGQNQVQYEHFKWRVLETEHFLIHYYPEERTAAYDAARMAERAYARLSRMTGHQFREKKPLILFESRSDFGQNNVTGDLGEGTAAVADILRQRALIPFTGDYRSFEHVLTHELVHLFQYDIFGRGKAGAGIQNFAQVDPPLWFMEGMAEYLSTGPVHTLTSMWLRDAALNGRLPSIEQMTERPDQFFPYRYGEALWAYVGQRWGDEIIGDILGAVPSVGIERAFKRELGMSLEDLSDEWREAMQTQHLPQVATLVRARKFSQPLLTNRKSGGEIFLAPALSDDGRYIAFLSNGSFLRGEVFIDLWLGDGRTGKRIKRLVKSTTDPDFEELRLLYSQSSFSPDGRFLAFTAQRKGKDVLYLLDVKKRKTIRRIETGLEAVLSPAWSPDGNRIVFSGNDGGLTDLYIVDRDGQNLKQLTQDRYGDMQPQWSPDGKTIAFASDRGPQTDFEVLRFSKWQIALYDVESGRVDVLPTQSGQNLNPQWAPDGRSVAYVSDRTGISNLFLYDLSSREHFQLSNVVGGVSAITEYSPTITWARKADRLAFTYFEDGEYTVWSIDNPRLLRRQPFREGTITGTPVIAQRTPGRDSLATAAAVRGDSLPPAGVAVAPRDSTVPGRESFYRAPGGVRASEQLPTRTDLNTATTVSVAALLDSANLALPDTAKFTDSRYNGGFQPEYVARPTVGYTRDNFGRGVFGGTTIVLADLLGNQRLAFSGELNGRVSEARLYAAYINLARRYQYITGAYQDPYYFLGGERVSEVGGGLVLQEQLISRYIIRQGFFTGLYPLNRFTRFETGVRLNNIDRSTMFISRLIQPASGAASQFVIDSIVHGSGVTFVSPQAAFVSDNTLFGYSGPIMGRRMRFQIEPNIGSFRWVEYLADYRRYDPILFNFLTVATRAMTSLSVGRDEAEFPKYIGRPEFIRGYDRERYSEQCAITVINDSACSATQLLGSRVAIANAELRFPLIRRFELGVLPIALPPLDGLVFYDAGIAWTRGQDVSFRRPDDYDFTQQRFVLSSYGVGLRLNLFNIAMIRWDYAIPLDRTGRKGFWTWSLGPSF